MDIRSIASRQATFDREHGWSTDPAEPREMILGVQQDIVGLVAEVGEFANIVQKIARSTSTDGSLPELEQNRSSLAEELTDSFIYLIRLANRLGVDLAEEYVKKLAVNEERFERFRLK